MINVLIDTSPLGNAHAVRGVGVYTRLLVQALEKHPEVTVMRSGNPDIAHFKPDLTHYPYFDLFFSTLPLRRKHPTVVTVHDVIPLKFPEHYPSGIRGKIKFWKQRRALRSAQAIITDSQASQADIVQHLNISESKIFPIYLAAHPDLKATDQTTIDTVINKYELPREYILYVGDINFNKNLPQLIKALKFLPESLSLVCIGKQFYPQPIPEWQEIETQLALSNVESRVHFLRSIYSDSLEELSALYSGALAYVQPSLYEGFGLPVLEALQCRTPVVSARNSSLVEVGGDAVVFTQTEATDLAQGIKEVLDWSATKRLEKVRAGFKWSQTFSWQKTADETVDVYYKVLGKPRL